MLSRRLLIPLIIAATSLLSLSHAVAESNDFSLPTPAERAAEYYAEAADAYQDGDFSRAAELLERAFAHDQDLVYKYNEALAYMGMEEYHRALRVLDIYGDPMRADERFPDVDELLREVREMIALQEEQAAQATLAEPESEEIESASPPILAYSLIASGGISLIAGGIFASGILISDTIDRIENSRSTDGFELHYGATSPHDRNQDLQTLSTHRALALTTLIGGTVLAGAGVALLLLDTDTTNHDDPPPTASFRLEPHLTRDFVGAALRGHF